ncbi:MAG: ABC transporter permease [Dehalococcoidales bacterium]|nr:ABC transporter permease [Dehalococcoidales bacterium]
MKMFSWRFIRLWQRNRDVFFRLWRSELPGFTIEPVIILLAFGVGLGTFVSGLGGETYIEFIAPGIVAGYTMFSGIFECTYGTYARMEFQNTFDAILATPLDAEDIIAGEIFWGATRAMLTGTAILIAAAAFQLVHSPWALLIPAVCFLQGILFSALAMCFTAYAPAIYSFNYFYTLFINPMFFVSGAFFPLSNFPVVVQNLSWIAPLAPAIHLTRSLFSGVFEPNPFLSLGILVVLSTGFFLLALVTMRKRLTK